MARVTVEDCLQNVKNRFELVMIAAKRARQLMRGSSEPKVAWENDKPTVVALREIAQGYTTFSDTHEVSTTVAVVVEETIFEEVETDIEEEDNAGNQTQTTPDEPHESDSEESVSGDSTDQPE